MADFFRSVTSGIARFVSAWLLPVAAGVGLFWAVCITPLAHQRSLRLLTGAAAGEGHPRGLVIAIAVAISITLVLSTLLAYGAQVIYRLLEGYHLPRTLSRKLIARQVRRRRRLQKIVEQGQSSSALKATPAYGIATERLGEFPHDESKTMPTRLGNALRTMESYGTEVFGLDSQELWYELVGTARQSVRQEQEEARALVDLFIAAVAVAMLLAIGSVAVGLAVQPRGPFVLAGASVVFAHVAYRGSVRNMKEWRNSVRALVNLGRADVADGLGMALPRRLEDEKKMWYAVRGVYLYQDEAWKPWLDVFRRSQERRHSLP